MYQNVYLTFSALLFAIGAFGVLTRKNAIVVFLCIEIMLGAANLAFIVFTAANQSAEGIFMVMCVMAVAGAEAAVGLAIFVLLYRKTGSINIDKFNLLKW
ncbi:MAG: NADH-quinone oxidoreductase subunit NuoK [Deltaproteobacteria bacterium]|nr:NADH-quinone oxidoreductase subunit NuoK [Deltaproteobacteria bacterium]